jgi:hypothetical protein
MRCLKKFIFSGKRMRRPELADAQIARIAEKSKQFLTSQDFICKLLTAFTSQMLGAGAAFLELGGDVFDGRQRAEHVNFLVRGVDVNL